MLRTVSRAAVVAAVLVVSAATITSAASANPIGGGKVNCAQHPNHPECTVTAETPEEEEESGGLVGSGGEMICRWDGEQVPCRNDWGWFSDGCYYRRVEDGPTRRDGVPGAGYLPRCIGDPPNVQRPAVWIPDAQAPGVPALGRLAVSRLSLPRPLVGLSPTPPAAQLVRLPTWLWIAPGWWADRTASAQVPGVRVTAVGTPVQVRWSTGDGAEFVCDGPGTPYRRSGDPAGASPDCGHTYTRSSAGQPGGVFTLAATVTWEVTWSGAGLSGSEGPLFSTTEVAVPVSEVQTVIAP